MNYSKFFIKASEYIDADAIKNFSKAHPEIIIVTGVGYLAFKYVVDKWFELQRYQIEANRPLPITDANVVVDSLAINESVA